MVTRSDVVNKIEEYIDNKIKREDIASWALKIVITKEYENIKKNDKLLSEAIHALFDLHHEDGSQFNPSIEELKIYKDKLYKG